MNKIKITTKLLILLILSISTNQNFALAQNDWTEVDKWYTTAKIWGFLKYYHPQVADGQYDWNQQLFEQMQRLEKINNKAEGMQLYLDWINALGAIPPCKKCAKANKKNHLEHNFDLSWLQDTAFLSPELTEKLQYIEANRHQGKKYYVGTFFGEGNIKIQNDAPNEDFNWQDPQQRLLVLFRYWNIVEYFFPYKYQTDQNWDKVLQTMIPVFLKVKQEQDYYGALLELNTKIDDSHGMLFGEAIDNYWGRKSVPARINIVEEKVIVVGFYNEEMAKKDDWQIGDMIISINGQTVQQIMQEKWKYINASNKSIKYRNLARYGILVGNTDSLVIEFDRGGELKTKTIQRYLTKDILKDYKPNAEKWKILEGNIGYVNMGGLEVEEVKEMMNSLMNTKAIVFDIRSYPKGTLYEIAKYLNQEPKKFVKLAQPVLNYPGKFEWTRAAKCGNKKGEKYKGKVVILINEQTQSYAEYTCMCLQTADGAIIIGSQTSGADGNVSLFALSTGVKTMITGLGVYYPDGKQTQRIGIVPDIEVKPSIKGIRAGRDEVLEHALEIINQ